MRGFAFGFWNTLTVIQLGVLFPLNLYFGFTGNEWSFFFAIINLIGAYSSSSLAADS